MGRPTWAEVSLPALRKNFRAIRALVGGQVAVMAVVKADAYGHGAAEVARTLAAEGAGWFGVTCAEEGVRLRQAHIAVVPAGYADGVNRALSNRGRALVRGCSVPVVGRVSMDLTLLDVTAVSDVRVDDEVVFIGRQGGSEVTAAEAAQVAGTVPYEILTNIGPRVPRIYLDP